MKLLYIIAGMYNSAGMERVVTNKVNYLSEVKGYDITILTTDQDNRDYYFDISDKIKRVDLNINFEEYKDIFIIKRVFKFIFKQFLFKQLLSKFLKRNKFDFVISLMPKADFLPQINDGSFKIYEHHFAQDYLNQFSKSFGRNFFVAKIYKIRSYSGDRLLKKFDKIVVLTKQDYSLWARKGFDNISVIPNSFTVFIENKPCEKNKIALSIGRLEFQKGFDRLINIWRQVDACVDGWQLHIYGDGPDKEQLLEQIRENNLESVVKIFPATKEIYSVINSSSIYLMASRFEGFPMVLIEAMSLGLPVVSFDCMCGPAEIIVNNEDGFVISEGDENRFVEKVVRLISLDSLRTEMGENAKSNIVRFSQEKVMNDWVDFFEKFNLV